MKRKIFCGSGASKFGLIVWRNNNDDVSITESNFKSRQLYDHLVFYELFWMLLQGYALYYVEDMDCLFYVGISEKINIT